MALYDDIATTLTEFGSQYTLTRKIQGTYDPITDQTNSTVETYSIIAILKLAKLLLIEGVAYEQVEMLTQFPVIPGDVIETGLSIFTVQGVNPIAFKGENVIFKAYQRIKV